MLAIETGIPGADRDLLRALQSAYSKLRARLDRKDDEEVSEDKLIHAPFHKPMPNPAEGQQQSPVFDALWQEIKSWDVNVPEFYDGYCGASGSHVALLLRALDKAIWGLAFEAAGTASAPFMRDHPDYVMPSEEISEGVRRVLADHGFIEPPDGYGSSDV